MQSIRTLYSWLYDCKSIRISLEYYTIENSYSRLLIFVNGELIKLYERSQAL